MFRPDNTDDKAFLSYLISRMPRKRNVFRTRKLEDNADNNRYRILIHSRNRNITSSSRICLSDKNIPCVFPFKWRGVRHFSCTTAGDFPLWCSHKVDKFGFHVQGNFGACNKDCPKEEDCKTTSGDPCVFPFSFKGWKYNGCVSNKKYPTPWCSTKTNRLGEHIVGNFGNCTTHICPIDD